MVVMGRQPDLPARDRGVMLCPDDVCAVQSSFSAPPPWAVALRLVRWIDAEDGNAKVFKKYHSRKFSNDNVLVTSMRLLTRLFLVAIDLGIPA
jgi:hypothetical protein